MHRIIVTDMLKRYEFQSYTVNSIPIDLFRKVWMIKNLPKC